MKSKRQSMRETQSRRRLFGRLTWGGLAVALVAVLVYAVVLAVRPAAGEAILVMDDTSHVAMGTDPGPYNSEPPSSGRHYEVDLEPGFYNEDALETYAPHPEGWLVHNLEHGYVIFWYNCELLDEADCSRLKEQIQGLMQSENNFKVIAFPRPGQDVPVALTSWGQLLKMERFDAGQASEFVKRNRNKAPEPMAD